MMDGKLKKISVFLFFPVIISIVILSLVPPVSRDALVHHLTVPDLYIQHGGMHELPDLEFSYYPMNLDLLYMVPLYLGNDITPKLIHFFFGLLTAALIYFWLKKRAGGGYAAFGAIFFLTIPVIIKLSITVYVDLGLIFFSTASLLSLLKWIEERFRFKYLFLSGMFCGLALGTKYNALAIFLILALFFIYIRSSSGKSGFFKSLSCGAVFIIISLSVASPWLVRNYIWTENPVYPLYDSVFNPGPEREAAVKNADNDNRKMGMGNFTYRKFAYNEPWWQTVLIPIRIFFEGKDSDPRFFDGRLNPFLLIFAIFAFAGTGGDTTLMRREKRVLILFSIIYFLIAFFSTAVRIRYIAPIIPPMVILSVYGIVNLGKAVKRLIGKTGRRVASVCLSAVLFFSISLNLCYLYGQFRVVDPLAYLSGKITRDQYIEMFRPEYPVFQYLNRNSSSDSRIMFFYLGKRGYYCKRPYVVDRGDRLIQLHKAVRGASSSDDIMPFFAEKGITHIMMNRTLFQKVMDGMFTSQEKVKLYEFFRKHLRRVCSENGVELYAFN